MGSIDEFTDRFKFDPERAFWVGVERECFVADDQGVIVPRAPEVLAHIKEVKTHLVLSKTVGYELSACQVETRTCPCLIHHLSAELSSQDDELSRVLSNLGLRPLYTEVAPEDMPLDVYPDPTGRYAQIVKSMPAEVLLAACRVIGTHVHIGMPDLETALRVYNYVVPECDRLVELGDNSFGERMAIYKIVEPDPTPRPFSSWQAFYERAVEKKFADDPRKCWTLVRISAHGTIEFRMFGATPSLERIMSWATQCLMLCLEAIEC